VIAATARTIVGRSGTFLSTVALAFLAVIAVAVTRAIVNARDPEIHPSIGGAIFVENAGGFIFLIGVLGGVLMGALAGSYDAAQGTMRYLLMTGVSRIRIYVSRGVALVLCVYVALLPGLVLMLVLALVLPQPDGAGIDMHDLLATLWGIALFSGVYALVSMGIGSLLHSNGAAITIALLINFALTPALFVIAVWSEKVASLALPAALSTLTGDDSEIGYGLATVAVLCWLALFLGGGLARILRDEY
jgi:ABC-type transport system involved in multi-copper enzyme maturation permease subunit